MKLHNKNKVIIVSLILIFSFIFFINSDKISLAKNSRSTEQKQSQKDPSKINDVAYGSGLNDKLLKKTKSIIDKNDKVEHTIFIKGSDVDKYLGTDELGDDVLLSSVWVKSLPKGSGVIVNILTPEEITSVNKMQYENIIITAGVNDVEVDIVSPVKVTGEYALAGLYKILEERKIKINKDRTQLAQNELRTMKDIDQENNIDNDYNPNDLCRAFLNIKKELAESDDIKNGKDFTREEMKELINKKLKKEGLNEILSNNNIDLIVDYFEKYQYSNIVNSKSVLNNLNKLSNNLSKNSREYESKNEDDVEEKSNNSFFDKVIFFFKKLFINKKTNFDNNVA